MPGAAQREFSWYEGLALFLCCIGIQLSSEVMAQWGVFFYSPAAGTGRMIYVTIAQAGTIFLIGILFDALSDPVIGLWSDKTRSQPGWARILPIYGRRRPFIFWGSIGMTVTAIIFWHPPVHGESGINFLYATLIYCLHSGVFFTMCAVPFNALAPEIARSKKARVAIGTWIAAGMITGLAIAEIAPGELIVRLDPARAEQAAVTAETGAEPQDAAGEQGEDPRFSSVGMQRTAILFAVIALVFFQFAVWVIPERFRSDEAPQRTASLRVMAQAFSNTVFLKYLAIFFLFNIGFLGVQRVLPYWATVGLGGSEGTVSILMAPFIGAALIALALATPLSRVVPIKWMLFISLFMLGSGLPFMYVIAVASVSPDAKIVMGSILFAYCGVGQGLLYMLFTPLLGEIIDVDEKRSGERREAVYTALHGLSWKASQALAVWVAAMCMAHLGNSPDRPLGIYIMGPMAGVFAALGLAVCWTYPVLRVTREADAGAR